MTADAWRDRVANDLDGLNALATRELDDVEPEPPGLPPRGSWIRAVEIDDDAHAVPLTPWHVVAGWDARWGHLSTRCRRKPAWAIRDAVSRLLGERPWKHWASLDIRDKRPGRRQGRLCRQCTAGLERDQVAAVKGAEAHRLGELTAVLPAIETLVRDQAMDDVERGRRLRDLWPA